MPLLEYLVTAHPDTAPKEIPHEAVLAHYFEVLVDDTDKAGDLFKEILVFPSASYKLLGSSADLVAHDVEGFGTFTYFILAFHIQFVCEIAESYLFCAVPETAEGTIDSEHNVEADGDENGNKSADSQ
jgi:hypothetical protein